MPYVVAEDEKKLIVDVTRRCARACERDFVAVPSSLRRVTIETWLSDGGGAEQRVEP